VHLTHRNSRFAPHGGGPFEHEAVNGFPIPPRPTVVREDIPLLKQYWPIWEATLDPSSGRRHSGCNSGRTNRRRTPWRPVGCKHRYLPAFACLLLEGPCAEGQRLDKACDPMDPKRPIQAECSRERNRLREQHALFPLRRVRSSGKISLTSLNSYSVFHAPNY
jgi:hypothetical protein